MFTHTSMYLPKPKDSESDQIEQHLCTFLSCSKFNRLGWTVHKPSALVLGERHRASHVGTQVSDMPGVQYKRTRTRNDRKGPGGGTMLAATVYGAAPIHYSPVAALVAKSTELRH